MDARFVDAPFVVARSRRRRRVHRRPGLWFMNRTSAVGSLTAGVTLSAAVFGLNATVGPVSIAEGMPDMSATVRVLADHPGAFGAEPWTLDLPPGAVVLGVTVALPLAVPPHPAAVPPPAVKGLEKSHPVDPGWLTERREAAEREAPRRVLCNDESTPSNLRSMCE